MWKLLVVAVALNILIATSCDGSGSVGSSSTETPRLNNETEFVLDGEDITLSDSDCNGAVGRARKSIIRFTFQSFGELIKRGTVLAAPILMWYTAAQLTLYSPSKKPLKFLELKNKEEIRCTMLALNRISKNIPPHTHHYYAHAIVHNINKRFSSSFKENVTVYLEAKAINQNFKKPKDTAETVRKYIAEQTHNSIKNAVPSSGIFSGQQSLVVVSGSYFESKWEYKYNQSNITQRDFFNSPNKAIKVSYVYQEADLNYTYSTELKAKVLIVPYEQGFYESMVILPDSSSGLEKIVQTVYEKPEILIKAMESLELTHVISLLPVYASTNVVLNNVDVLRRTGQVNSLLQDKPPQLEGLFKNKSKAYLSNGAQSVIVNNNLDGIKASNYDGCATSKTNKLKHVEFTANRRTINIIMRKGLPLFIQIGKVKEEKSHPKGVPLC